MEQQQFSLIRRAAEKTLKEQTVITGNKFAAWYQTIDILDEEFPGAGAPLIFAALRGL